MNVKIATHEREYPLSVELSDLEAGEVYEEDFTPLTDEDYERFRTGLRNALRIMIPIWLIIIGICLLIYAIEFA